MPPTGAARRRLAWQPATVASAIQETATARTLVLDVDGWSGHVAGQHVDIRLTAEDGTRRSGATRCRPGRVSRPRSPSSGVDDGEVSPFLVDVTDAETSFEVRGPFGGSFVWEPTDDSLLLAGLRPCGPCGGPHAVDPVTVLYSARAAERIIYAEELAAADFDVEIFLARDEHPDHRHGQFDAAAHTDQGESRSPAAAFVCGPTAFVETVANALADTVLDPLPDPHRAIRTRVPALPPAR